MTGSRGNSRVSNAGISDSGSSDSGSSDAGRSDAGRMTAQHRQPYRLDPIDRAGTTEEANR
jgi:hypothetical protein